MVNARLIRCATVLALAALVLTGAAWLRSAEYDEQYTLFLTAGVTRPVWPERVFRAASVQARQEGHASLGGIARALRATDVHPPLYFWAAALWRRLTGGSLLALRLLSVLCSLAALAAIGGIAVEAGIPPALAMLLTLGCYGFAYTGAIARDFAMANALTLIGVWGLLRARAWRARFAGGALLGAATATNYLAAFAGIAAMAWATLSWRAQGGRPNTPSWPAQKARPNAPPPWAAEAGHFRLFRGRYGKKDMDGRPAPAMAAEVWSSAVMTGGAFGFAIWLPLDLFFFLAQRGSRTGQFPHFAWPAALHRLAEYSAANLFGGLPLYVGGVLPPLLSGGLAAVLLGLLLLVVSRRRHIGRAPAISLLAAAAVAPPIGLLFLGVAFDTMPIELRYLAFSTPFAALLLAGALAGLPRRAGVPIAAAVLAIQAAALTGLLTRPETMQPARATAAAAARLAGDGVVLLSRGNDGIGIVGAFAIEAPPGLHLLVVGADEAPAALRLRIAGFRRVVVALPLQDAASRAAAARMLAAVGGPCWRQTGTAFDVAAFDRICGGPIGRRCRPRTDGQCSRR